jgi:late competence protein required for DNA uptake (superfamily II DNA/RNA helicase)
MPRGIPGSGDAAIVQLKCARCGQIRTVKAKQLTRGAKLCRSCSGFLNSSKKSFRHGMNRFVSEDREL